MKPLHAAYKWRSVRKPAQRSSAWPGAIGASPPARRLYVAESERVERAHWRGVRWRRILIDHLRCQRCGRHFPYGRGLSAHHIRSRKKGGDDSMGNLISLCPPCQDWVEGRGLNRAAIIGSRNAAGSVWESPVESLDEPAAEPAQSDIENPVPVLRCFWISGAWYGAAEGAKLVVKYRAKLQSAGRRNGRQRYLSA